MTKRNLIVRHGLTQEEAIKRLKTNAEKKRRECSDEMRQYQIRDEWTWEGNIATVKISGVAAIKKLGITKKMGFAITAAVTVTDSQVEITVDIPAAAMGLAKFLHKEREMEEIEERFQKELTELLS